jgi:hypothetical protein
MLRRELPLVSTSALCAAWLAINFLARGNSEVYSGWWYDTGTKKVYVVNAALFPPIVAPSGEEGVGAVIYATKDCADENDRFIMYLFKYTPEGLDLLHEAMSDDFDLDGPCCAMPANMMLVKTVDEAEWVHRNWAERQAIIDAEIAKRGSAYPCYRP